MLASPKPVWPSRPSSCAGSGTSVRLRVERISALRRRKDDLDETQRGLDAQVATVEADLTALRANLRDVVAAFDAPACSSSRRTKDLNAERSARAASDAERIRLMALVADRERQIADASRRRALLVQRNETDAAERARLDASNRNAAGASGVDHASLRRLADRGLLVLEPRPQRRRPLVAAVGPARRTRPR